MKIKIKKVRPDAKLPTRAYIDDAGLDFYYCPNDQEDRDILPQNSAMLNTGFSIEVPDGFMLEVKNKSGIAGKQQLLVGSCVIDRGYTGEVFVNLNNVGNKVQTIKPGQKIAQGVFVKIEKPELVIIEETENLYDFSERKDGALGSTGNF
jgi:dUTP pyrophosphatase